MLRQRTVLTVLLVLCAPVCWSAQPSADDTGKPANEGKPVLTLKIRCDAENLKVGDEIPITFVIANEGEVPVEFYDFNYGGRSGREYMYGLAVLDDRNNAVPDPRAEAEVGWSRGGGAPRKAVVLPGASFTKIVALNLWARMTKPGEYKVAGTYVARGLNNFIRSAPVWITVHPRTDLEMADYIEGISDQMAATNEEEAHADLICKLMYTHDTRIVPAIIEGMYKSVPSSHRGLQAFLYYLPRDQSMVDALLAGAQQRGLANGMASLLMSRGCTTEQIKSLIEVSLSPQKNWDAWRYGAMAAEAFPDDRFTARLIAIANDPGGRARDEAIHSLATNRTDESVAALKQLLRSADESTRRSAQHAIRSAYRRHGRPGRPLRDDDFDLVYRKAQ